MKWLLCEYVQPGACNYTLFRVKEHEWARTKKENISSLYDKRKESWRDWTDSSMTGSGRELGAFMSPGWHQSPPHWAAGVPVIRLSTNVQKEHYLTTSQLHFSPEETRTPFILFLNVSSQQLERLNKIYYFHFKLLQCLQTTKCSYFLSNVRPTCKANHLAVQNCQKINK